jgi:glycosyltransferase involved in cell wall biosynthesis
VEEAHVPVFERMRDKSGTGVLVLTGLLVRLALAYGRLVPEVALRLLRSDALMVGYIGQGDILVLGTVARLLGRPVIFNPLVTLTDTIIEDRQRFRAGSLPARLLAAIDRIGLRMSDLVLTDTASNARYLRDRFGVDPAKIIIVPVGADEAVFYPTTAESVAHPDSAILRSQPNDLVTVERDRRESVPTGPDSIERQEILRLRPQDDRDEDPGAGQPRNPPDDTSTTGDHLLDVVFVGKFIPLHGIDTIIRAAAILKKRSAPIRIELVGTGQTYAAMRSLADRLGVDTLVWTDWIPFDRLGDRLRQADVALGVFDAGAKAGRVIPNKVYQSIACGVATVTRCAPDVATLLHHGESALLVPPDDTLALADAIESLIDPQLRQSIGEGGRRAFEARASRSALARDLRPVQDLALARGRRGPCRHGSLCRPSSGSDCSVRWLRSG